MKLQSSAWLKHFWLILIKTLFWHILIKTLFWHILQERAAAVLPWIGRETSNFKVKFHSMVAFNIIIILSYVNYSDLCRSWWNEVVISQRIICFVSSF